MSMSFPPNAITQPGFTQFEPVLTPKQLKERYLFGLPLKDVQGNEIPEAALQHYISSAIQYLEMNLDIVILERTFEEKYDYRAVDYTSFNFIQLKKRPLCELIELKAMFPNNTELVKYPEEWYVVEKEGAQIQLSPVEGSFSGLIVTQGGSYVPLIYGTRDYWPHLFNVKYKAGFCPDQVPVLINEMIGMQAAIRTFEVLGDIIYGPGVAGENVSLDAASVSRQTTAAAQFTIFSARIKGYKDQMKEYMATVRKYYNAIPSIIG